MSERVKWSELSERERDALVAEKVMGLDLSRYDEHVWEPLVDLPEGVGPEQVSRWCSRCWGVDFGTPIPFCQHSPQDYTEDIAAAWEVVEKMEAAGWGWTADRRSAKADDFAVAWRFHLSAEIHRHDAPDTATAICIAALRSVGVEVDT